MKQTFITWRAELTNCLINGRLLFMWLFILCCFLQWNHVECAAFFLETDDPGHRDIASLFFFFFFFFFYVTSLFSTLWVGAFRSNKRADKNEVDSKEAYTHTHTRTDSVNFLVFSLLAFWLCYLTPFSGSTRVADTKGTHAAKKVPHTQHLRPTFFFLLQLDACGPFIGPPHQHIIHEMKKYLYPRGGRGGTRATTHTRRQQDAHTKKKNVPSLFGRSWPVLLLI